MFIGREQELEALRERLTARRPIVVLGEAGVGKTTLVRVASEDGPQLVEAGALATLAWLPYFPVRRAFGHDLEGDVAFVASRIEERLGGAALFVDDLQWADVQTAALVPLLATRVGLVIAVRRGDAGTAAALEVAASADAELLPLEPLTQNQAEELAGRLHPTLAKPARRRLATRSGGNPFLLEELGLTGEARDDLTMAVAARLHALTGPGRVAIGSLALLGRPAEPRLLGPGSSEIVSAGLATTNGEISIRHELLAEATIEALSPDERMRLHSQLAAVLDDPGEAARHHAAAGEREAASAKAHLAATRAVTLGERVAHLAVAAANADADAHELRLEAAAALADVGQHEAADALLTKVEPAAPLLRARAALVRSRVREASGDVTAARTALAEVDGDFGHAETEVLLAVQRAVLGPHASPAVALRHAQAALALAQAHGFREAEARATVARAKEAAGRDDGTVDLEAAITLARARGDVALECRLAEARAGMLFNCGRGESGRDVLSQAVAHAAELRLTSWERRFRARMSWIDLHLGRFRRSAEEGEALLMEALDPWQRFLVTYVTAQASIDLADYIRAGELIESMARQARGDQQERQTLWTRADAEFWAGRPREAIETTGKVLARFPHELSVFARLTHAWAHVELELDPGDATADPHAVMLQGARPELEAAAFLVRGAHQEAAARFRVAVELWRDRQARGELRCLWGHGEALRRAGDPAALRALEEAEARALELDGLAVLTRIRRSLRLAGARRNAPRTKTAAGLTGRESEVLELVAQGLTNEAIARRLGVSRPTVVRLIGSAQHKLGATSRTQAAALAARQ